jgi:hypothetical protein
MITFTEGERRGGKRRKRKRRKRWRAQNCLL